MYQGLLRMSIVSVFCSAKVRNFADFFDIVMSDFDRASSARLHEIGLAERSGCKREAVFGEKRRFRLRVCTKSPFQRSLAANARR